MESKNKNTLIVALLAVVLVMAVGYAAFAQTLSINGTAKINSTWDVHFNQDQKTGVGNAGFSGGTTPTGEISYSSGTNATVSANLYQPGDTVTFTLTIENGGSINAKLQDLTLSSSDSSLNVAGDTATSTSGNIKYTVTSRPGTNLNAGADDTITVVAEYVDIVGGQGNAQNETVNLTITMNYVQA